MNRSARRPIATVRLHTPIEHKGYTVACIEVPCPKPGRPYAAGLEHAELVVGTPADGCNSLGQAPSMEAGHPSRVVAIPQYELEDRFVVWAVGVVRSGDSLPIPARSLLRTAAWRALAQVGSRGGEARRDALERLCSAFRRRVRRFP